MTGNAEVYEPGHVVTLRGLMSYSITPHRTRGGGHLLNVGGRSFTLDADFEELVRSEGITLPEE